MTSQEAENLRKAIEGLINVKLHDALAKPGGLERLVAHRVSGVASYDVRMAERRLDEALTAVVSASSSSRDMAEKEEVTIH